MEFKIIQPEESGFVKAIEWNHEEIKQEIQEKVAIYKSLVYTDDQVKDAKADRAELNKFKTALETKRKEVKAQCLAPYENFEKQMKEIVAIIDEPIKIIDNQVKEYEEKKKAEKDQQIREYFATLDFKGFTYEQIMDSKWMNAGTSMKAIKEAIDTKAAEIEADMLILAGLPEYSFEATENYKKTMSVREAMAEANHLADLARQKAEFERAQQEKIEREMQQAQEELAANVKEAFPELDPAEEIEEIQEEEFIPDFGESNFVPDFEEIPNNRTWCPIKAYITPDDKEALIEFFNSRSIDHEFL